MIENSLDKLSWEFKIKSKVLMEVSNKLWFKIIPFETKRSLLRQKWLKAQGKSRTLKSKHLEGKAVDRVFVTPKWQPTRSGPYKSIHYLGALCGCTPIYNTKGQLIESCHLQDTWESIAKVMARNSMKWHKETKKNQTILSLVNTTFRKYWYK